MVDEDELKCLVAIITTTSEASMSVDREDGETECDRTDDFGKAEDMEGSGDDGSI